MLPITVPYTKLLDERSSQLIYVPEQTLQLEHSLVSLSKWESKFEKPFLSKEAKTAQEMREYVKFMTLSRNVSDAVYYALTSKHYEEINRYIEKPMTATTFRQDRRSSPQREQVTAELIYYWMIALNIPFECQKWHLNRLLTLIRVCSIKNQPPKKWSKRDILSRNAELNAARRKRFNSKG